MPHCCHGSPDASLERSLEKLGERLKAREFVYSDQAVQVVTPRGVVTCDKHVRCRRR
jgi:hypothetical protein